MKKTIRRGTLILWAAVLALLAAFVIFIVLPLYGPKTATETVPPAVCRYDGSGEKLVLENEELLLEMDSATTYFTVTEKSSGRVWSAVPADADRDPIALSNNKTNLKSTLIVNYTTSAGSVDMNNYTYSIQDGTYCVHAEDDAIRVDYTVGTIGKIYRIPLAITKEDYTALTANMKKADKSKVSSAYALYDPKKIAARDDAEELMARYPTITEQPLYILRSDTRESNKAKLEESFAVSGYTQEDYERDSLLVTSAEEKVKGPVFNVSLCLRLEGNDLVAEIPYGSIRWNEEYPMTGLSVLPMFGCAGTDEEGYLLVPEGGGALMFYNNGKVSENPYIADLYGWDYGEERLMAVNETGCSFPVFGMTGNGGGFLCMLEGAAPYASITAGTSGRINSYNYAYAGYTVLHCAEYDIGGKSAVPVYVYEKELPDTSIVQRYRFTGSADYPDMAAAYRERLIERYPSLAEKTASEEIPVSVELIGAIDKKVVRFGLPVTGITALTTFEDAARIMNDLNGRGIRNTSLILTGWCNGGLRQKVLSSVRVQKQLGGEEGLRTLTGQAVDSGNALYLSGISSFAYRSGLADGFRSSRDVARFLTRDVAALQDYNIAYFEPAKDEEVYYLADSAFAGRSAQKLIEAAGGYGAGGVSMRDIGKILSSDLNPEEPASREQARDREIQTLISARGSGLKVAIENGNEYAVPYADLVRGMTLHGTSYAILDEFVPFYQAALHGLVDYTGRPIDLDGGREELLSCAEYGAGLSYIFISADNSLVRETDYTALYSVNYDALADRSAGEILRYQSEMAGLNTLRMTGHCILQSGVSVTEYEDGTRVYVNYTQKDFSADGVTVPAEDYLVVRGGAQK